MRTPTNERLTPDIAVSPKARTQSEPAKSCAERRCVVSDKTAPRETLVRLVASPAGLVLPDVQAKAPGRGAWIGVSREELEVAQADGKLRGALARAFKTGELQIPDDLPDMIEKALIRLLLDRLGLEIRTGALILGSHRIADAARSGEVAMLCHASDASDDGTAKLDQAWRVGLDKQGSGIRGIRLPLDRAALSVALGRENVVHLALAGDDAAERVNGALARLLHYLGHDVPKTDQGVPSGARRDDEVID